LIFLIGSGSNYEQDGILPYAEPYLPVQRAFQFPTGWNSTNFWVLVDVADDLFQFPTGIEMRNSHIPHSPPFRRIPSRWELKLLARDSLGDSDRRRIPSRWELKPLFFEAH